MVANVESMFYVREKSWHGLGTRVIRVHNLEKVHTAPLRRTANYQENLFAKTIEGNPMIDKAYAMMKAV